MATIRYESKCKIEIEKQEYEFKNEYGNFKFLMSLDVSKDKLTTTYIFNLDLYSEKVFPFSISEGHRLVLFDSDKKFCTSKCISTYKRGNSYVSASFYGKYEISMEFSIDEDFIKKLNELNNAVSIRLETTTSYVELEGKCICNYMKDAIALAQKAILKSSDDILNF
jgi:hypothetical protein